MYVTSGSNIKHAIFIRKASIGSILTIKEAFLEIHYGKLTLRKFILSYEL